MKEKINKIIWISGKCGYGKTEDDALTTYRRIYSQPTDEYTVTRPFAQRHPRSKKQGQSSQKSKGNTKK
jgi:hypothetical protein